jgi:hypothetical protein
MVGAMNTTALLLRRQHPIVASIEELKGPASWG